MTKGEEIAATFLVSRSYHIRACREKEGNPPDLESTHTVSAMEADMLRNNNGESRRHSRSRNVSKKVAVNKSRHHPQHDRNRRRLSSGSRRLAFRLACLDSALRLLLSHSSRSTETRNTRPLSEPNMRVRLGLWKDGLLSAGWSRSYSARQKQAL